MRFLLAFLFGPVFLFGQKSVFNIKPAVEAAFFIPGIYLTAHGLLLERKLDGLTLAQLDIILAQPHHLDYAERHYSAAARRWSNALVYGSYGIATASCFSGGTSRRALFTNVLMLAEAGLLTSGTTQITKVNIRRLRPYIYNDAAPSGRKLSPGARLSFFSGHTSSTAVCTFFAAKVWTASHRGSRLAPLVWSVAATYPMVVGFLRMQGGMHHFRDVATGYAVGAAFGVGVPFLHQKLSRKKSSR